MVSITWSGPVASLPLPVNTPVPSQEDLVISNLTVNITGPSFEGEYRCIAQYTNCIGTTTSNPTNFIILLPPTISEGPVDQVVDVESNVSLTCTANLDTVNLNTVSITWTGPVTDPIVQEVTATDSITSTLTVSEVEINNGGEYTCTAGNEAGSDSASSILYIRPVITPAMILTSAGENVTLTCGVQDTPPGTFQWEKMNLTGMFNPLANESERNLTLYPVEFGDEGTYRCIVNTSQFGEQMSSLSVITGK